MVSFTALCRRLRSKVVPVGFLTALIAGQTAFAETAADVSNDSKQTVEKPDDKLTEVVVTGSRIHRDASDTTTDAPLAVVGAETLTDRGYTQVGDALNQLTGNTPQFALTPHNGSSSGSGQQFPNLFNLGAGRTLTLVNGRRFVNSGVAVPPTTGVVNLGDSVVDTNMIPTGLLDRVEVAQAGGSVVYGSDAIAGVVNYILKDHFTGATLDMQSGITEHGDYPQNSVRATLGSNFLEDRGNVAINMEWSKSDPLRQTDRTDPALGTISDANPLYTGANSSGITPSVYLQNAAFWEFNNNGVLFAGPPGASYQAAFGGGFFITQNGVHFPGGTPTQFNTAGTGLIPYNPGTFPPGTGAQQSYVVPPFASGGDGYPYQALGSLFSGVERYNTTVIGHVDLTPQIKVSTELFFGHTTGTDPLASQASFTVLNNAASGVGAIPVLASNPYLPASAKTTIVSYLNTTFGGGLGNAWLGGAPIPGLVGLSKNWPNLLPSTAGVTDTDTLRGLVALDGHFSLNAEDYFWEVSASRGYTRNESQSYNVLVDHFNNAVNAVQNSAGQIVCAINRVTVTDPACIPLNPFGSQPVSAAAQNYVSGIFGQTQQEKEDDLLATFGGPVATLPGGAMKFNSTFEHRSDAAQFNPTEDTSLGLGPAEAPTLATAGEYKTNEFSTELLVPLLGKEFTLPGIKELEISGAYRHVDNSIAGTANLWNAGLRWTVVSGLTLRASHGTNFRAPNLNELFSPSTTALGSVGTDPCDSRFIASGINPAARLANCQALFAANPSYNGGKGLAGFQDPAVNFATAAITSGGNSTLANEVSRTWTVGFVLQPEFVPGFTFVADRIEINLKNAITQFAALNYVNSCFDATPQPTALCGTFTRDANGDIITAKSSFLNAGYQVYKGETYNINYRFSVTDADRVELNLETTHNAQNDLSVTGTDLTRTAGTALNPRWVTRFDASWNFRLLRLTYSLFYLPRTLAAPGDTAANSQYPYLASNAQHSLSAQYQVTPNITVRAGIVNLTNAEPSYPSISYGDILGRRFFVGVNAHL
jgi:outer membrane receptor protein involved in Fe transport